MEAEVTIAAEREAKMEGIEVDLPTQITAASLRSGELLIQVLEKFDIDIQNSETTDLSNIKAVTEILRSVTIF
jgi:hypothetical protein